MSPYLEIAAGIATACVVAVFCFNITGNIGWIIRYYASDEFGRVFMAADEVRKKNGIPPLTDSEKDDYIRVKLGGLSRQGRRILQGEKTEGLSDVS